MKQLINIANGLTLLRILLLPWLVGSYAGGNNLASGLIITVMILSDFFDGKIARRQGTAGPFGAIFDVSADFALVFIFQIVLMLNGRWPPYIFGLSLLSAATFILGHKLPRKAGFSGIGRYSGGAIMLLFLHHIAGQVHPSILSIVPVQIIEAIVVIILSISVIENIHIPFSVRERGNEFKL